jgi:hypothetical protein
MYNYTDIHEFRERNVFGGRRTHGRYEKCGVNIDPKMIKDYLVVKGRRILQYTLNK